MLYWTKVNDRLAGPFEPAELIRLPDVSGDTMVCPAPKLDDLSVTAKAVGRAPRSRTYTSWIEHLGTPAVKQALGACWTAHRKATRDDSMTVQLSLRYAYKLDEYDDFQRSTLTIAEVATTADAAASNAAQCARTALVPIADEYSRRSSEATWKVELAITMAK